MSCTFWPVLTVRLAPPSTAKLLTSPFVARPPNIAASQPGANRQFPSGVLNQCSRGLAKEIQLVEDPQSVFVPAD
jgi:hypothetical protein